MNIDNSKCIAHILTLWYEGKTCQEIATRFNLTRQRIQQLIKKYGDPTKIGGKHLIVVNRRRIKKSKIESDFLYFYGCSKKEVRIIENSHKYNGALSRRYIEQRRNAIDRNIPWEISFPEWWRVWEESGKWEQRGRGHYCMLRTNDIGPYKIGNIRIGTSSENAKEAIKIALENGHNWGRGKKRNS